MWCCVAGVGPGGGFTFEISCVGVGVGRKLSCLGAVPLGMRSVITLWVGFDKNVKSSKAIQ